MDKQEDGSGNVRLNDRLGGPLTECDYEELADSYLAELDEAKEVSGYNAYLKESDGRIHWTFRAYLIHLRKIKAKDGMKCVRVDA